MCRFNSWLADLLACIQHAPHSLLNTHSNCACSIKNLATTLIFTSACDNYHRLVLNLFCIFICDIHVGYKSVSTNLTHSARTRILDFTEYSANSTCTRTNNQCTTSP